MPALLSSIRDFTQALCRPSLHSQPRLSREYLEQNTDLAFDDVVEMDGDEAFIIEDGALVGVTGTFQPDGAILGTTGQLINGIVPHFQDPDRVKQLRQVARSTCFIVGAIRTSEHVSYHPDESYSSGTGFYIAPNFILTAAHVVNALKPDSMFTQVPGIGMAHLQLREIVRGNVVTKSPLKVILDMTKPGTPYYADLAVVYTPLVSPYISINWTATFHKGQSTDVVGYPGQYSQRWLDKTHGSQVLNPQLAYLQALLLLPQHSLTVSSGEISHGKDDPLYKLTTAPGMSGSPVFIDGKVAGLHTGFNQFSGFNRCVSLGNAKIQKAISDAITKYK